MRYAATSEVVAIRLSEGEDVRGCIAQVCEENNIDSAVIMSGVGMLRDITFGWFNGNEYVTKDFNEVFELLALSGNVSIKDQTLYPHLHGAMSRPDHSVVGGHILRAVADHNVELFLKPLNTISLARKFDGWFDAILPLKRGG